jgi:hypothetical protein
MAMRKRQIAYQSLANLHIDEMELRQFFVESLICDFPGKIILYLGCVS